MAGRQPSAGYTSPQCALWLIWRPNRGLFGRRNLDRFARLFRDRWRGFFSMHDEAVAGLVQVPTLSFRLFRRNLMNQIASNIALLSYLTVVIVWWSPMFLREGLNVFFGPDAFEHMANTEGTPFDYKSYPLSSYFNEMHAFAYRLLGPVLLPLIYVHALMVDAFAKFWFDAELTRVLLPQRGYDDPLTLLGLALSLFAGYVAQLWLWILILRAFFDRVVGPLASGGLNKAARAALVRQAYGSRHVRELPTTTTTTPFEHGPGAQTLPPELDQKLMDFAVAHIGDTYRRLHLSVFDASATGADSASLADAAVRQMTWSELVHTAYFRVTECRTWLAKSITVPAVAV